MDLTRGRPVAALSAQRGPAEFNELRMVPVCNQTEFEVVTQETRQSFEDIGPHETETVMLERGKRELARIDLLIIEGQRVVHGAGYDVFCQQLMHDFIRRTSLWHSTFGRQCFWTGRAVAIPRPLFWKLLRRIHRLKLKRLIPVPE